MKFASDLSNRAVVLIKNAYVKRITFQNDLIYPQHFLLSVLDIVQGIAHSLLRKLDAPLNDIYTELIDNLSEDLPKIDIGRHIQKDIDSFPYSDEFATVMMKAKEISREKETKAINSEHILFAITEVDGFCKDLLEKYNIDRVTLESVYEENLLKENPNQPDLQTGEEKVHAGKEKGKVNRGSLLQAFGTDLCRMYREGKLGKVIGRKNEIDRLIHILNRKKKNNPILLGESGVGKTAILEGLAARIVSRDVPKSIQNKKIITLDLGGLVAGTKYRGQFEERFKSVIKEVESDDSIILAIDEMHTIVSAGSGEGSLDAANMLKDPLTRASFQCIGLTTWDEYKKHLEPDKALARRFNIIKVSPPDVKETTKILQGIRQEYSTYHGVIFTDEIIDYIVRVSDRYISNKFFPDKAIDLMDEIGAKKKLEVVPQSDALISIEKKIATCEAKIAQYREEEKYTQCAAEKVKRDKLYDSYHKEELKMLHDNTAEYKQVTISEVAQTITEMTGIPVSHSEDNLADMKSIFGEMKKVIRGQDSAVEAVCKAVLRGKTGLKSPNKPIATLLFAGPTGTGKTETARKLAELMFGSKDALIIEDMSSYSESHSVSRLIGCFHADTRVKVMRNDRAKLVNISEVELGDIVITHRNTLRPVREVKAYPYEGELTCIIYKDTVGGYTDIIKSTPDHEYFAISKEEFFPKWIKAKDLKLGDSLLCPVNKSESKSVLPWLVNILKYLPFAIDLGVSIYNKWKRWKGEQYDRSNYKQVEIVNLLSAPYNDKVYDLSVDVDTSYTVGSSGVAVHNSPPGYIGHDKGGSLTNKIQKNPYSVILFDEIEKADKNLWNLLLPLLEQGRLNDAKTEQPIDFTNTIVIMTTNMGSAHGDLADVGLNTSQFSGVSKEESEYEKLKGKTEKAMKKILPPEFLNRVDQIVVFDKLSKESVKQIINLILSEYNRYISELHGFTLELSETVVNMLIEKGYSQTYGARELRRSFDNIVLDDLVAFFIDKDGKIPKGTVVKATLDKNNVIKFNTTNTKKTVVRKKELVES